MPPATTWPGCQSLSAIQVAGASLRGIFQKPLFGKPAAVSGDRECLNLGGEPPVTVELRPTNAARRLSLRVSRLDGRVSMSLPRYTGRAEALEFAREKENWIRKQLAGQPVRITPTIGGMVLFEGRETEIIGADKGPVRFEDGQLLVPGEAAKVPARLAAYLKTLARRRLILSCDHYATALATQYQQISLRDTRSRWGSCTSTGNLMFSWRLIMAAPDVLDYVAAHEVAHLLEMNHSSDYWANVARVCPDYQKPRNWLRKNAALLHSYQFRN